MHNTEKVLLSTESIKRKKESEGINLHETEAEETTCVHWISHFPESFTFLATLNISCLEGEVNVPIFERLISRCPNLKTPRLNHSVPLERLVGLLHRARQLIDLGTGKVSAQYLHEIFSRLESVIAGCKRLRSLSGFCEAVPTYLPAIYSICEGLTSLNLSYAAVQSLELTRLVSLCKNLQRLLVMDLIEDNGLIAVAASCKLLRELQVFPSDLYGAAQAVSLTEHGLVAVSAGCPMLQSVLYFCQQMTNTALLTVANNSPNLICFRLCIMDPHTPDYITQQPRDAGFSAIVESCRDLRRLSLSGLVTDLVFKSFGTSANRLEMLSVAFAGDGDAGLHHILSGCKNLRKLVIRDCTFGNKALLENASKLETMQSLSMLSCFVTLGACRQLAQKMPRFSVEVISEKSQRPLNSQPDSCPVEKLYIY